MSVADYCIVSKPDYISFDCPECGESNVQLDFEDRFWQSGSVVECPECGEEITLGDYEYD